MSKKQIEPESDKPEGLGEFEQFVKNIFTLPEEQVKEILDREKREGIPPDPDAQKDNN